MLEADGEEGTYWIEEGAETFQALVYVPSFSEHEITIEKGDSGDDLSALILDNIAVVLVAVIIIVIMVLMVIKVKSNR